MSRPLTLAALLALPAASAQPEPSRTFTSPHPEPGGQFGYALGVLGDVDGDDVPDLVVGAPGEQVSEDPFRVHGRAYVLSGATGDSLYALASPSDVPQFVGYRGDFGAAVAAVGDLDGDAVPDFAVGAPDEVTEEETEGEGTVYVFSGATGAVLLHLTHPEARYREGFGAALAALGDVDGDDVPDVGVGAVESGEQVSCGFGTTGLAYVFSGATGSLVHELAPPTECETYFGASMAGLGDVDGDGVPDFAVGSLGNAGGALRIAGRVHVYSGATAEALYVLESPNAEPSGGFGRARSLASMADLDGDGVRDLLVGAGNESVPAGGPADEGRTYGFSGVDGALLLSVTSPNAEPPGYFGTTVGEAGDLDGDGTPDLLVAALGEGSVQPGDQHGRVYAISGATGDALFLLDAPQPTPLGVFGWALDGTTDFTGDGQPDLVVSQPGLFSGPNAEDPGVVFVYDTLPTASEPGPASPAAIRLDVAPNPAAGAARVTWGEASGPARLSAYDVLGRAVAVVETGAAEARLDLSDWAPGVYVLRLETAAGATTRRFTVAR